MKKIKKKIQELLELSEKDPKEFIKEGIETSNFDLFFAKINMQDKLMDELKDMAKENDTILGRIIKFPHADFYAFYIITKVNKITVRLKWIDYGDAWVDDRCGYDCNISYYYAKEKIDGEDQIEKLFGARKS